jgi:nucleoside-diphosphate-sugar epimerase
MNALVTGITGFIGSRLASRLVDEGYNVHGLVRHSSERDLGRISKIMPQVHLIEGDLGTFHSILSAVDAAEPNMVFHLGALTPVRLSFDDPYPYVSTNFEGTLNLVHAILKEAPNSRLIAASTAEVYGWQEGNKPIRENAVLNPASPYAVTKAAADEYVQMANRVYHLQGTVLRPINSYGRMGEKGFFIEYLVSKMLAGDQCYVGAPDSVRDYMFADDHVNAYMLTARSSQAVGQVYNVSPGNPITNSEVAKMLAKMTDFKGRIALGSYPPGYPQRPKMQDPQYLVLDNSKITKELGWKPTVGLEEGLARTIETWKNN